MKIRIWIDAYGPGNISVTIAIPTSPIYGGKRFTTEIDVPYEIAEELPEGSVAPLEKVDETSRSEEPPP